MQGGDSIIFLPVSPLELLAAVRNHANRQISLSVFDICMHRLRSDGLRTGLPQELVDLVREHVVVPDPAHELSLIHDTLNKLSDYECSKESGTRCDKLHDLLEELRGKSGRILAFKKMIKQEFDLDIHFNSRPCYQDNGRQRCLQCNKLKCLSMMVRLPTLAIISVPNSYQGPAQVIHDEGVGFGYSNCIPFRGRERDGADPSPQARQHFMSLLIPFRETLQPSLYVGDPYNCDALARPGGDDGVVIGEGAFCLRVLDTKGFEGLVRSIEHEF